MCVKIREKIQNSGQRLSGRWGAVDDGNGSVRRGLVGVPVRHKSYLSG